MTSVLVVDDEQCIVQVTARMLEELGHRAVTATTGPDAVRIYAQSAEEIDVVILDYMMPEMNGADICRSLREINPHVKIFIASGICGDLTEEIVALRVAGFLHKPYRLEDLSRAAETAAAVLPPT